MRIHRDERGQTILLVALSLPILIGFIGIATDVGSLFKDKRTIQTAADAAAIAGALNLNNGTWLNAAKAASGTDGFTDGSNGVTVTIHNGPTWSNSSYLGLTNYIEATVSKTEPTIFLALFGYPSITVLARAVATNQGAGNGCVYTLGTTGTDLTVQGSLSIDAPDCAFNIASSSTNAIDETGNGGSVITSSVGVVGPIGPSGYGDFTPKPVGGVIASSDPLSSMKYPYTCTSAGCTCPSSSTICSTNPITSMPGSCGTITLVKKGTTSLPPGCYNLAGGTTVGSQNTLSLTGGVYFFENGALNIQAGGEVDATGVTMIMTGNSTITMNGNPTLDLTAPDSTGTFPGILYYQVPADTATLSLQGGSGTTIEGVFYAPTAAITFQGNPGGTIYTDFVVNTLTLAGNPSFKSFARLPGGASNGLHAVALVE